MIGITENMEIQTRAAIFRSWGKFKASQTGEDARDHPLMSDASQIKECSRRL